MSELQIDNRQVLEMFSQLSNKKMKKVHTEALRKAAKVIQREAKIELRKATTAYRSNKSNLKNGWHIKKKNDGTVTAKSLQDGIRVSVAKDAGSSKVHILGDFRLKWFEKGTNNRQTRKGYNRGAMKSTHFFKIARQNKEQEAENELQRFITESILRVAKK